VLENNHSRQKLYHQKEVKKELKNLKVKSKREELYVNNKSNTKKFKKIKINLFILVLPSRRPLASTIALILGLSL
jgi:hypothetical protein